MNNETEEEMKWADKGTPMSAEDEKEYKGSWPERLKRKYSGDNYKMMRTWLLDAAAQSEKSYNQAVDDCITAIKIFTPKSFPTTFEKIIEELNKLKSNGSGDTI